MRHDQLKQQTNVLLAIVTRGGGGASPGDGYRVETPANDRQTEHAVKRRRHKVLTPPTGTLSRNRL